VSHELARQSVTADLQRERDRLEEFANVVSHDLRNPLSVAAGQLTLEQAHRDDESEHLDRAAAALTRMDTLLGDLLALAKAGDELGEREPVSLADLVGRSWQTVDTGSADLQVETEATVDADPVRLAQLFENLFHNAVEHGGGDADSSVTVTVRDVDGGFVVDDDGPGIAPEERPAVTETGYTTSSGGSGFGLHIVEQIAHAHGWSLEVATSPSGGARFRFTGVDTVDESPEPVEASDG
jgi:signal transduction histidine kinase